MNSVTGSSGVTRYFEFGSEVYPCRCGTVHRGDYAAEDWMHHNCFHDAPLVHVAAEQFMCPDCGKDFWIEGDESRG